MMMMMMIIIIIVMVMMMTNYIDWCRYIVVYWLCGGGVCSMQNC